MRTLVCSLLFLSSVMHAQFTAHLLYGIPVPVCTWNGEGSAFDFAKQALDSSDAQGKLVILGRDTKRLWYFEAGCSNDAQDSCFSVELASIDSAGNVVHYEGNKSGNSKPALKTKHVSDYSDAFKKHKLNQLIPVSAWECPYTQSWIAQVNCPELHVCFQFNYNITPAGGCWNNFEWESTRLPLQSVRTVRFSECLLTIPADWKYVNQEKDGAYVSAGTDTLFYVSPALLHIWFIEMTEYDLVDDHDSLHIRENERIRKYNDSLHQLCPEMLTHVLTRDNRDGHTVEKCYPREGITSWMRYTFFGEQNFGFRTTALTPEEQEVWKKVLNTCRVE